MLTPETALARREFVDLISDTLDVFAVVCDKEQLAAVQAGVRTVMCVIDEFGYTLTDVSGTPVTIGGKYDLTELWDNYVTEINT